MINKQRINNLLYDLLSSINFITNENNQERRYSELKEVRNIIKEIMDIIENGTKQ